MTHELLAQISTNVWWLHSVQIDGKNTEVNNLCLLKPNSDKLSKISMPIYPVNRASAKMLPAVKLVMRS
jgi:hypothetical protein